MAQRLLKDASEICTHSERAGIDLQIKNLIPKRSCRVCLSAPIQKLAEYRDGDRNQDFDNTYYGGEPCVYPTEPEQLSALKRIRTIVINGYVECKPRRDLLKGLDIAMAIIEGQAT